MKRTILYGMLFALLLSLGACTKDETMQIGPLAEGEGKVSVAVDFRPLTAGLAETRTAGDVIKAIEDLSVFFYRTDGTLVKSFYLTPTSDPNGGDNDGTYKIDLPERYTEAEAATTNYAERFTPRATFKLTVPFGRYYIYTVANMGDLANSETYRNAVKTADGLRSIQLQWQSGENNELVGENKQMFGFFDDGGVASATPAPVTIDATRTSLHAWLRRAASKLTVAFDASKLKDNIAIYIHSVQIKDIPATCYLGKKNTPASDDELIHDGEAYEYPDSEYIVDHSDDDGRKGLYLSNGPHTDYGGSDHAENDPVSLFFYENMQTANGNPKWQDESGQNKQVSYPDSWKGPEEQDYKDDVPYGTYVEVKGYYVSDNPGRIGHGPIIYRFMLGKDVDRNYEAERNHHYQLTLQFNGYANDIDWHIEYTEPDPGVFVKTPQYISYLYDRKMTTYVKVVGNLQGDLKAEILENHWWPDDAVRGVVADTTVYYWSVWQEADLNRDEHGFLSLTRSKVTDVVGTLQGNENALDYANRRSRSYKQDAGLHNTGRDADDEDGSYEVRVEDATPGHSVSRTFAIPFYTRARTLTEARGYSGNNAYFGHQRSAMVRFTANILYNGELKTYTDEIEMHQVKRLGNPAGIWRSSGNDDEFHVQLQELYGENIADFRNVVSDGPWRAEMVGEDLNPTANTWYTLTPEGESEQGPDGTIVGKDRTPIEFKYQPNGKIGENEVRCGIIRIYYNNYTCVHLIFVRQGYAPIAIKQGSSLRWHTRNVIRFSTADGSDYNPQEASDPRDEGSYFKWNNPVGMYASNNRDYGFGVDGTSASFKLTNGTNNTWNSITRGSGAWTLPAGGPRVASYADYQELFFDKNTNPNIQYGFGVLYADGATQTATTTEEAYRYYGDETAVRATRGMRGCFVYNNAPGAGFGNNLFFPIGATGYGRRKDGRNAGSEDGQGEYNATGVLRYANRFKQYWDYANDKWALPYRPMFYDIHRQLGGVYWCQSLVIENGHEYSAWDINFSTFNFRDFGASAYTTQNSWCDACMIRLVEE